MASISCEGLAAGILRQCLAGERWQDADALALADDRCSEPLFRILVEGLADRFDPRLCDAYAEIFSSILEKHSPDLNARELLARYERVRRPRIYGGEPRRIVVLSRVTLGADIAVTSVILNAVARRFPEARIFLAGSAKAAALFAGFPRVEHMPISYPRSGSLTDRLFAWRSLSKLLDKFPDASVQGNDTLIVDPDSRLTQLGLLPVCPEDRYLFFESRAYGGDGDASLTALTRQWAAETFGIEGAVNAIAPPPQELPREPFAAVSFGSGDNPSKQLPAAFEAALIRLLCARFQAVIVDNGFGPEESARVAQAIAGTSAVTYSGSFAGFCGLIAKAACYVGYDSAGQHAAAALGTPLLTLFKGFASDRMFARWQPTGPGAKQVMKLDATPSMEEVTASLELLHRASQPDAFCRTT